MKKSINLSIILLFACSILWAGNKDNNASKLYAPYNQYTLVKEDLNFWQSKELNSISLKKQAQTLLGLYSIDCDLEKLFTAEQYLNQSLQLNKPMGSGTYKLLAQIKMKQHRFCEALDDLLLAEEMGDEMRYTQAMLFDVYFELGNEDQAVYQLATLEEDRDFEYLIRAARYEDSRGNLNKAISLLEEARDKISNNDWNKQSWAYSNLADFYGHAGEINKSQDYFLKALELNPADWYSLKGLAWIEYAAFGNSQKALSYLEKISSQYFIPSVENLKIEILEYESELDSAEKVKTALLKKINKESYHSSYNSMIFDLLSSDKERVSELKHLIAKAVENRATAENYSLLAQSKILEGKIEEARSIALSHVMGKTFEPDALRRILPTVNKEGDEYFEIASILKDARFELGPVLMKELDF